MQRFVRFVMVMVVDVDIPSGKSCVEVYRYGTRRSTITKSTDMVPEDLQSQRVKKYSLQ